MKRNMDISINHLNKYCTALFDERNPCFLCLNIFVWCWIKLQEPWPNFHPEQRLCVFTWLLDVIYVKTNIAISGLLFSSQNCSSDDRLYSRRGLYCIVEDQRYCSTTEMFDARIYIQSWFPAPLQEDKHRILKHSLFMPFHKIDYLSKI